MRIVAAAVLLAAAPAALAVTPVSPKLEVSPATVRFGHTQDISGKDWGVAGCRSHVSLKLRSAQNEFTIGSAKLTKTGSFDFGWTPSAKRVGAGRWMLVASNGCATKSTPIRIKR